MEEKIQDKKNREALNPPVEHILRLPICPKSCNRLGKCKLARYDYKWFTFQTNNDPNF